ncbi:MAG: hypothetical protein OZ921_11165 [Sorangiineae bacterium]|nr:hypothetical protein [Polyangiaceae bacterium]MEB2323066.1 hypothetical protein [Sorangiineae bacterium]
MRSKIIIVNAGIVVVVGLLSFFLLHTSLGDLVSNPSARKQEVEQALRAANAQLALDALRLERWLGERAATDAVRGVFSGGTSEARSESATAQANKLRDAAVGEAMFAKMAPSMVLFVDQQGVALGRNGSALMRGDKMAEAYPPLGKALASGTTGSAVWLNRDRQEQMFVSYASVHGDDGKVIGAIVVGTPLNDERLARTSTLTSGRLLVLSMVVKNQLELVANSGKVGAEVITAAASQPVQAAAQSALASDGVATADATAVNEVFGAMALTGYEGDPRAVLVSAVPASLVPSLMSLLWPVFGVSALGILLVVVGGVLLGNYFDGPLSELEDGMLAIINGRTDLRFQIEHAELGGLVFRLNSLLNALMGVPEDTTDDEGRPSRPPTARDFQEALAVDESSVDGSTIDPARAAALAAEPAAQYYARLYGEYIAAKRQVGDPVDHITEQAFVARIQGSEQEMLGKHGRPVRYQAELRAGAVVLVAVPLPR